MYAAPMQSLNQAMGSQSVSTDADLDKWGAIFGPTFPVSNQPYQGGYRTQHENPPADRTLHNGYLGTLVYGVTNLDLPEFLLQILPIQQTSVLDYNWDVMYFNTPMAGIVPHEAAGRVLTHSYSSGGEKSVRHAIGMLMDIETMKRPFGMTMFGLKLQQMRNSIQLTLIGDVIHALLDTNNPNHPKMGKDAKARWMASQGIAGLSRERLIKQEINDYAIVHKDPINGMRKKLADIKPYAQQWGFKPNAIICNDNFKIYSTDMITDPTMYLIEAYGQTELRRGPENVAAIDGIPLYAIPPLNLYQETQNIPSLNTHVQIGEYALMIDPRRDSDSQKCEPRTMVERSIMMYDENKDDWVQISILEAINACGRFDDNGNLNDTHKKLARVPDNMDMFLCKDANGHNMVCELFGDMEEVYLDPPTVQQMARSMLGSLDDHDRAGVNSLVDLYNSLVRNAGTAPEPILGAGPPAQPAQGRGGADGVNPAAQLNYYVPGNGFFSVTELRDRIRKLDHDWVRHSGFFASWLGLELLAYQNMQVKEHLSAFLRFYHAIKQAVGTDHPFVTEEGCPAHLRPYVDEPGAANLFERVFGNRTTPMVAYQTRTFTENTDTPNTRKAAALGKSTAQLSMPLDQLANMKPTIEALDEAEQEKFFAVMKAYTKLGAQMHQLADEIYHTPAERAAFIGHVCELPTQYVQYFAGADVAQFKERLGQVSGKYVEIAKSYNDGHKGDEAKTALTVPETIDIVKKLANFDNLTRAVMTNVSIDVNVVDDMIDVQGSDYRVTNRAGSMLLPIVYTSTRSSAWNNAMKAPLQNIVGNYVFSIYKPSRAGMVPVTVTGRSLNEREFEGEVESLNEYRSFAHRRLVLQEPSKYGVMEHVDHGDGGEHGRHPTERLPRQHESQMVKRRAVDSYDQDRMGAYPTDPHFMDDKPSFMHRYEMLHTHPNAAIRGAMFAFLTTKITRDAFKRFAQQGCLVPCNFVIARPFDVHIMGGVMVLEGGLNTGRTMFAMSNWVAGISPETKLFYANYTFYSKAIIFRPERVVHMPALKYEEYCGGHNTIFLTHAERENIASRGFKLTIQDYAKQDRASMYSMMVPYCETTFDVTFDLRGWYEDEDRTTNPTPAYASAQFYSLAYHFDRLRKGMDYGMNLWYKQPQPNLVVTAGPWRAWSPDGSFAEAPKNPWSGTGKGHHGQYIKAGVTAKERSGLPTAHAFPKLTSVRGV